MTSILGTGSALPECVVTNDDYTKTLDTSDEWIYSRTGIKTRHIAKTETITELALLAAKRALLAANTEPGEIGLIVSACITPYNLCPSLSCELMALLGASCPAFDINGACSGFIYALKTADAMRNGKKALVLGAEKLSSVTDFTDRATAVLFGDGAGACVIGGGAGAGILSSEIFAHPDVHGVLRIPGLDNPEPSVIRMNGRETFKFATRELAGKAKRGELTPADCSGGVFSVSYLGSFEVDSFIAIVNPGESAILAVGKTVETPVVVDGNIFVRPIAKMTLSSDHRSIDGALAARLMDEIKRIMENPAQLL